MKKAAISKLVSVRSDRIKGIKKITAPTIFKNVVPKKVKPVKSEKFMFTNSNRTYIKSVVIKRKT